MKKIMLLLLCFILSGCAGMADYTISLGNGFRIDRLSAHQIQIYGDEPIQTEDETVFNHLYVPAKVTEVWWDDEYIVAKQMVLVADERNNEQPPKNPAINDFYYWIIDVDDHQVWGPFDEKELENEMDELGMSDEITLTQIEKLR